MSANGYASKKIVGESSSPIPANSGTSGNPIPGSAGTICLNKRFYLEKRDSPSVSASIKKGGHTASLFILLYRSRKLLAN
jgi:hypothetical protein